MIWGLGVLKLWVFGRGGRVGELLVAEGGDWIVGSRMVGAVMQIECREMPMDR